MAVRNDRPDLFGKTHTQPPKQLLSYSKRLKIGHNSCLLNTGRVVVFFVGVQFYFGERTAVLQGVLGDSGVWAWCFCGQDAVEWMDLARSFTTLGELTKASRSVGAAVKLAPTNRFIVRAASRFYVHSNEPERALSLLG